MNPLHRFSSYLLVMMIATLAAIADPSGVRSVRGTVIDAQKHPLSSAVVYLYSHRTGAIRTYYSDDRGSYHFSGLKPYDDYTVHAEHRYMTSKKHAISSTDQKQDILLDLKVDKQSDLGWFLEDPEDYAEWAFQNRRDWRDYGTGRGLRLRGLPVHPRELHGKSIPDSVYGEVLARDGRRTRRDRDGAVLAYRNDFWTGRRALRIELRLRYAACGAGSKS